jgi:hypothetical protein
MGSLSSDFTVVSPDDANRSRETIARAAEERALLDAALHSAAFQSRMGTWQDGWTLGTYLDPSLARDLQMGSDGMCWVYLHPDGKYRDELYAFADLARAARAFFLTSQGPVARHEVRVGNPFNEVA